MTQVWGQAWQILNVFASICTVVGVFLVLAQMKQAKKHQLNTVRAFLTIGLEIGFVDAREMAILIIRNTGQVSAHSISLDFESPKWNSMKGAEKYAFLGETGISSIPPMSQMRYILGPMNGGANMAHISTQYLEGEVHYKTSFDAKSRTSEKFRITLSHSGFLLDSTSV